MKPHPFDRNCLKLIPIEKRESDLSLSVIKSLKETDFASDVFRKVAQAIKKAREKGAQVILMMGAHVLRAGMQNYLIDLMENGFITCIATNGAGIIHDYEFALIGKTTESVARYIRDGSFGMWEETGKINDIVADGISKKMGIGLAVGTAIASGEFPHKNISIAAAAARLNIPLTVHVSIGYDITHQHPNFDGAAYGTASYNDFLTFAACVDQLEDGVLMNFGSAVMGPEVFLKSLSMVRNKARRENRTINSFTTLVCDLMPLPEDVSQEVDKQHYQYYFRPYKTLLVRTVAGGGDSFYERGDHGITIPGLWTALKELISS